MASTPQNPRTGSGKLNGELIASAAALGGPAAALASGASATSVAAQTLKDSALVSLLGPTTLFATAMLGVLSTIKKIVGETGILARGMRQIAATEQIQGKFETLLKSATLAKARIKELYDFTRNSPFRFEDVAEANRQLQALTQGALAGANGMKLVGDAAAATGQQMSDVAERVGRAYAALSSGRSLDRIIFQMQQTGLVTDVVAKKLEDLETVGAGFGEKWGVVEKALRASQGGMQNEVKSLEGLAAKLANAGAQLERAFAEPFRDAQARSMQVSIDATENVTPVLAGIAKDLAPLLNLTTTFKNSIAESTLATKGFADALGAAWQVGKIAFTGIAAATVGRLAGSVGVLGRSVGGTLTGAAQGIQQAKAAGGGLAKSSEIMGQAGAALGPGGAGAFAAATLAAEAVALKATTVAAVSHAQAMRAVGTSTGLAAAASYAGATATMALGGALTFVGRAAAGAAVAVRAAFIGLVSNPVTATLLAAGAAVSGFAIWRRAIENADKAYSDLSEEIAATNKRLNEQIRAVSTTEEWTKSVNDLTDAYGKAKDALTAFQAKQAEDGGVLQSIGDALLPGRKAKREASQAALENEVANRARALNSQVDRVANTGLSDREREQFKAQLHQVEGLRDQKFQQDINNADGERRNEIVERYIALLKEEAAAGRAADNARNQFDRSEEGKRAVVADADLTIARADENRAKDTARRLGLTDDNFADPVASAARLREDEIRNRTAAASAGQGGPALIEAANQFKAQAAALDDLNVATERQKTLAATVAAIRRSSPDELTRNLQGQADIREDMRLQPVAAGAADERVDRLQNLQKRAIEINESVSTFRGKEAVVQQAESDLKAAKRIQALKALELKLDKEIVEARLRGEQTVTLEIEKQLKLLKAQLDLAPGGPAERREAEKERQGKLAEAARLESESDPVKLQKNAEEGAKALADLVTKRDSLAPGRERDFIEAQITSRSEKIARDTALTPEEQKAKLEKAATLRKEARTPQDKLRELNQLVDSGKISPEAKKAVQAERAALAKQVRSAERGESDTPDEDARTRVEISRLTAEKSEATKALGIEQAFAKFAKEGPEGAKKAEALKNKLAVDAELARIAPGGGTQKQAEETVRAGIETEAKAKQEAEAAALPKEATKFDIGPSPAQLSADAIVRAQEEGNRILSQIKTAVEQGGTIR